MRYPREDFSNLFSSLSKGSIPEFVINVIEGIDGTGKTTLLNNTKEHLISTLNASPLSGVLGIDIINTYIFMSLPYVHDRTYPLIKNILETSTPDKTYDPKVIYHLFELNMYSGLSYMLHCIRKHIDYRNPHITYTLFLDRSWISNVVYQKMSEDMYYTNPSVNLLYPIHNVYYLKPSKDLQPPKSNKYDIYSSLNQQDLHDRYIDCITTSKHYGLVKNLITLDSPIPYITL